jgi:hypothetical protein
MEALLANPAFMAFLSSVGVAVLDELIRQSALSSNSLLQLVGKIFKSAFKR